MPSNPFSGTYQQTGTRGVPSSNPYATAPPPDLNRGAVERAARDSAAAAAQAAEAARFQTAVTANRPVPVPSAPVGSRLPTPRMAASVPVPARPAGPSRRAMFASQLARVAPQMRYAKGGAVSKRRNIDGIAQRGKTRGRIL